MGLKNDIHNFVVAYEQCQRNKMETINSPGLLHPLPISSEKWEYIDMDFITGLNKVSRNDCIFVVVNHLAKYIHFIPIDITYKSHQHTIVLWKTSISFMDHLNHL